MYSLKLSLCFFILFAVLSINAQSGVIRDDFRVHNDSTGNECYSPDAVLTPDNSGIILWQDSRNGEPNIYAQSLDSTGGLTNSNFKLSSYPGNYSERDVHADISGDSILATFTSGYGQWLDLNGSPLGSSFRFDFYSSVYEVDGIATDSGIFVVGYRYTSNGTDIYIRRFDHDGTPISDTLLVNDDGTPYNQWYPRIAKSLKYYIVVWSDYRSGTDGDIYAQLFDQSGNKVGTNFRVNDPATNTQDNPDVAMDSRGNFVVVWADYRNGNKDIYAQRFDSTGTPIDTNFIVNDDVTGEYQDYPAISMDSSGNFTIVWLDTRDGPNYIYAQMFDSTGNPVDTNWKVSENSGSESQFAPSVFMNEQRILITWDDQRDDRSIYYREFNIDRTPRNSDTKVNDVTGVKQQYAPAIAVNSSNYCVITWYDNRESQTNVLYSAIDNEGNIIEDSRFIAYGSYNDVKVSEDSTIFCVVSQYSVYIKYYILKGSLIDSGQVEDTSGPSRLRPSVAIDSSKNFVVVWQDSRNGNADIYGQMFTSTGTPVGPNFIVSDDPGSNDQYIPDVAMTPSGRFFVVWYDYRNGNYDIYGQLFENDGSTIGGNLLLNDTTVGTSNQYRPAVDYTPDGNFVVVWYDYRTPSGIYGQLVDTTGAFVGNNVRISTTTGYMPDVSVNSDGVIIATWQQYYSGLDIYARMLNSDLSPMDSCYKINNDLEGPNINQDYSAIAIYDTTIYIAWRDPKWQMGYDIAGKVLSLNYLGIKENHDSNIDVLNVSSIVSEKIRISYTVLTPGRVKIALYNITGQCIRVISEGFKKSGNYEINLPVSRLSQGIYFVNIRTRYGEKNKKVVVIK